jgi:hypothetical protein
LQKSPSQQPAQELGVQTHLPCEHSWLEPHGLQATPPVPQVAWVFPGTQLPMLSQQPWGQIQLVLGVHCAAWQVSLLPQVLHSAPPVPQAASLVPATQAPWESQHPLPQVELSQATALQVWLSQFSVF